MALLVASLGSLNSIGHSQGSAFLVNSTVDAVDAAPGDGVCATAGGVCTLRAAVQEANAAAGARVITLPAGTYTLTIAGLEETAAATGDLNIAPGRDVTINGVSAASTIIDANKLDRAFQSVGGKLTVNDVTVRNGYPGPDRDCFFGCAPPSGGCFYMGEGTTLSLNRAAVTGCTVGKGGGAGVFIDGYSSTSTLTITDTTIAGNSGDARSCFGGGIYLSSNTVATINRSTISGNSAYFGGGLGSLGVKPTSLTLTNSTISGNTAASGGALEAGADTSVTLTNVTIASNSSPAGAVFYYAGSRVGQFRIRNTIIANSSEGSPNCGGQPEALTDLGNNVEFPGTTCRFGLPSDRRADPLLGPLASNGGPTQTHALGSGSPAIDLGDPSTCAGAPVAGADQRGFVRPSMCDAGAFEFGAAYQPTMSFDRTSMAFAAVSDGTRFTSQTPSQTVRLRQTSPGTVTWTAASSAPWLAVSPASGSGSATLTISTSFVSGLTGTQTGRINLTLSGSNNPVPPIDVTLTVVASTAPASPPFGSFDTPPGDSTVLAGTIAITGWTLDNVGVKQVELWRDLQPGETTPPGNTTPGDVRNGKIFIAVATFVDNARPDVEGLYPTIPANYRAGWGYPMLTWGLPGQGNGTYRFYAFGVDQEGGTATIGTKTVVISNSSATKPFGSIDTPAIGGVASGPNFGWALTPKVNGAATCRILSNGVQVSIDSAPLQPVVYGDARSDVAGAFPGFSNSAAAGGHFLFDWSTLTNGTHTIGWLVTDDCNRADGIGSRFFTVTGGTMLTAGASDAVTGAPSAGLRAHEVESDAAITVARGFGELPEVVTLRNGGSRTVEIKQGERIEIRVPRGFESVYQLGPSGQRRALPIGSTWDPASETFYWHPATGFLGRYRIVFSNGAERISVRVIVVPRD